MQSSVKSKGRGRLFLIFAWSSELHSQGPPPPIGKYRQAPALRFHGVMLPSADKQTLILTYDVTLECCCDVWKGSL